MRRREAARVPVRVPPEIALAAKWPVGWQHWAPAKSLAELESIPPGDQYRAEAVFQAKLAAWQVCKAAMHEWADSEGLRMIEANLLAREAAGLPPRGYRRAGS